MIMKYLKFTIFLLLLCNSFIASVACAQESIVLTDTEAINTEINKHAEKGDWDGVFEVIASFNKENNSQDQEAIIEQIFAQAYDAAIILARNERYVESLSILDALSSYDYASERMMIDRIVINVWQGNYKAARDSFEGLSEDIEKKEYLLRSMILAYRYLNDKEGLLGLYTELLQKDSEDYDIRVEAYELAKNLEDRELAQYHNVWLQNKNPDHLAFVIDQYILYIDDGQYLKGLDKFNNKTYEQNKVIESAITSHLTQIKKEELESLYSEIIRSDQTFGLNQVEAMFLVYYLDQINIDTQSFLFFKDNFDKNFSTYADDLSYEIANHFLHKGFNDIARDYFIKSIEKNPTYVKSAISLAAMYKEDGQYESSLEVLNQALIHTPDSLDLLFFKGNVLDEGKDFLKAYQTYDEALSYYPDNQAAKDLKSRALMDLGATSLVVEDKSVDEVIYDRAKGDEAMNYVNWREPGEASYRLKALMTEKDLIGNIQSMSPEELQSYLRPQWDWIIMLRQEEEMKAVIEEYETYVHIGIKIPSWIKAAAADAYLYEKNPEKAITIYEELIDQGQNSHELKMSYYYTLVELDRLKDASKVLNDLDKQTPVMRFNRGIYGENWDKEELAVSKGWLLMYQDRLKTANEYITDLHEAAPFNSGIRTVLAHNYMWRGWSRKALDEFKIIRSLDPDFVAARIGHVYALNQNMYKKEARESVDQLLMEYPKNKHAQRAKRAFEVEDMNTLTLNATYTREYPGEDEFVLSGRVDFPVTHHHTMFVDIIRRETSRVEGNDINHRMYVGDQWQINRTWKLIGALSGDYKNSGDIGYLGQVVLTPHDQWRFDLGYEKNIFDVPLRSRIDGVQVDEYSFSTTYRLSEQFNTAIGFSFRDFTDGNENVGLLWRTDSALYTSSDWKLRLGTEYSYSTFSKQDVNYYSPESLSSVYLIPTLEHKWYRKYDKSLVDRLSIGAGQQWQKDFGVEDVGFVQYEHDYSFSDTKSMLIGTRYSLHNYDGEDTRSWGLYMTIRFKF